MASDFSFDVVSKIDVTIVDDCINNALKEILNRYDFKDTKSDIKFDRKELAITLTSADEYKVKALYDVMLTRLAKRNMPLKNFQPQKIEDALGGAAKQVVKVQQGIPQEKAKEMSRLIKDNKFKANSSIQGDTLRITSKSKDELQAVMAALKAHDFGITVQFENFR